MGIIAWIVVGLGAALRPAGRRRSQHRPGWAHR
jgi:hypothetical protein